MLSLEYCIEHTPEFAQEIVNEWGKVMSTGHGAALTPDFRVLSEQARRYQAVKRDTDFRREPIVAGAKIPPPTENCKLFWNRMLLRNARNVRCSRKHIRNIETRTPRSELMCKCTSATPPNGYDALCRRAPTCHRA